MNPILKIKDENGNWIEIPAIKGEKGDVGPVGPQGLQGEAGKDAVTDQSYNSESENAQSGIAVAEALITKMDKFGEVTETDELIEVDLENLAEDGSSKRIRFKFQDDVYFERYYNTASFVVGDSKIESTAGSSGWDFGTVPLRGVNVYEGMEEHCAANLGYVNKKTANQQWKTIDEHTVTADESGYIDQYSYSSFSDGTYFDLTEVFISIQFPEAVTESDYIYVYIGGVQVYFPIISEGNTQMDFNAVKFGDNVWRVFCGQYTGTSTTWRIAKEVKTIENPEDLTITSCAFPEGTVIKIFGKGVLEQ